MLKLTTSNIGKNFLLYLRSIIIIIHGHVVAFVVCTSPFTQTCLHPFLL
jgi:hypothetical protein